MIKSIKKIVTIGLAFVPIVAFAQGVPSGNVPSDKVINNFNDIFCFINF